ncbi:transcriptional regulator, XRE family [Dehalogenimonas lykanthroporepellens BL-DC-9]|nr:transcriptional regulator, XRE family [Dehalogenimonas lykanthroporepellens BL-DC-9]
MDKKLNSDYKQFEEELLSRPEVKREYDALAPKYQLIQEIIRRRNELKISQRELARRIGTRQPAISRLEAGDYNARIETLLKVTEALDLDFSLMPRKKNSNQAISI